MTAEIVRRQTPEEKEVEKKRLELTRLEAELLHRELELTTLRFELSAFEREYLRVVGLRYAELDDIEARIAAIQAERSPADSDAQQAAKDASVRAEASAREANASQSQPPKPEFVPTEDLKKLSPPYSNPTLSKLRRRAEKATASGRNLLNEMAADIDKKIAVRQRILADLTQGE